MKLADNWAKSYTHYFGMFLAILGAIETALTAYASMTITSGEQSYLIGLGLIVIGFLISTIRAIKQFGDDYEKANE